MSTSFDGHSFSPSGRMLEARGKYRRLIAEDEYLAHVTLAGLAPDDEPILLREIYVPLLLSRERLSEQMEVDAHHHTSKPLEDWLRAVTTGTIQATSDEDISTPLSGSRVLFISGDAGSGKTTLLRAVAQSLAGTVPDDFNRHFAGYIAVPIILRLIPIESLQSLEELLLWWLNDLNSRAQPELRFDPQDLIAYLTAGHGIIILDGLDELGTATQRRRVIRWLNHPWATSRNASFVMVTGRPSGFQELRPDYRKIMALMLHVAPFSIKQIHQYLEGWFALRPLRATRRRETVDELVRRLQEQPERLLALARRPAYLAALAFVHGTRGALPHTRAELYRLLVDAYLEALDRHSGVLELRRKEGFPVFERQEKLEALSAVAYQAHVGWSRERPGSPGRRSITWTREELESAVRQAIIFGEERFKTLRASHTTQLTEYFIARTGLLVESAEGRYEFGHLSFQEYLAALFILDTAGAGAGRIDYLESTLLNRLDEHGWSEVGLLALAIDADRTGGRGHQDLLARLDVERQSHRTFLARVLAEPELRLSERERAAWLAVWLAGWISILPDDRSISLISEPRIIYSLEQNQAPVQTAWSKVAEAAPTRIWPTLKRLATVGSEKELSERSMDFLSDILKPRPSEVGAAEVLGRISAKAKPELLVGFPFIARDYTLLHLGETTVSQWLVETPPLPSSAWSSPLLDAFLLWASVSQEIQLELGAKANLLYLLTRDELCLPLLRNAQNSESPDWRRALWKLVAESEAVLGMAVIINLERKVSWSEEWRMAFLRWRQRAQFIDGVRTRLLEYFRPERFGSWSSASESIMDQAALLGQLRQGRRRTPRRVPFEVCLRLGVLPESARNDIREWSPSSRTVRHRRRGELIVWSIAAVLPLLIGTGKKSMSFTRADCANRLALLSSIKSPLQIVGEDAPPSAVREWATVLASPLSPVGSLKAALELNWNELTASREGLSEALTGQRALPFVLDR